ncbi:MAG: PAS domain S-box protein [Hyphomonadaceae bacterium]|nr:PAS domain S-box protein [Hyphomonadaceae bacterium]
MSGVEHTRAAISGGGRDDQLYASLESMPDGFILLDAAWRFTYINGKAEVLLQRGREALLGKNMWDEFPEGADTIARREYTRVKEHGGSTTFELDYPPLGMRLEVRAFASQGGLAVYFRDITGRHHTQETMRLLQSAISRLKDVVIITTAAPISDGPPIVFVNEAFTVMTGYTAADVLGRSLSFLHGEHTDPDELSRARDALRTGASARTEIINYTKDGREIWVEGEIAPLADDEGVVTHYVVVARDITQRKRAELMLKESTERFRIVAQTTADVVWDWNLVDDTMWWSDGMRSMFGYEPERRSATSDSWSDAIHVDDRARVLAGIHAVIDGDGEKWADEYRFIRGDGSLAQVTDRGSVIRDSDGRAVRMVGSMVDVTSQRELEAQLRQSQRLEAVGQLTGGVAHDFNNLLTVILSNAELLETRLAGNDHLHMLAEMTRLAAERGAELTSRLLSFSRRQALDPRPVDVAALVRGMDQLLRRALGEQVEIVIVADDDVWDAQVDALQLESALLNLCINARDAMPGGGVLTIDVANATLAGDGAQAAGEYVTVSVTDTGTGMNENTRARVFEPFFTTKEVGKGSGLGLSMVYGFVTQSKGRIGIESELGAGTTVNVHLPRSTEVRRDAGAGADEAAPTGHERILLVEDDNLLRAQVAGELANFGYRVVSARTGAEAMQMLREGERFDLLFTDVVMAGGMSGAQLAALAREIAPAMPVLYTSGHPETMMDEEGYLAPGVTLLRKPYRRRELAAKLREVLGAGAAKAAG